MRHSGNIVTIVRRSFLQCFMLCSLFLQLFFLSCVRAIASFHNLYAPWISIWHHWYQGCQSGSRGVIMTQVLLLFCCCHFHYHHVRPHLAPRVCCSPLQEASTVVGSRPLACKRLYWEHNGWNSLTVHADVFESLNLSNVCNQTVTTTLPFSEGLYDVLMALSCHILLAHVWVHATPKDVALRVITYTERAACIPGYWLPRHV